MGAPTSSASAGKILFWRALNRVDVADARYLDFDQLAASRAVYDYRRDQRLPIAGERIDHADGRRELLIP